MPVMNQITLLIKRLRATPVSLSQSEIHRLTGIPQPRISRWEAGAVPAAAQGILRLVALGKKHGIEIEAEPVKSSRKRKAV